MNKNFYSKEYILAGIKKTKINLVVLIMVNLLLLGGSLAFYFLANRANYILFEVFSILLSVFAVFFSLFFGVFILDHERKKTKFASSMEGIEERLITPTKIEENGESIRKKGLDFLILRFISSDGVVKIYYLEDDFSVELPKDEPIAIITKNHYVVGYQRGQHE